MAQKKERQAPPTYVGPAYTNGIVLPGLSRPVRPAEMTPAERKAFLTRYPDRAAWWKQPEPEPPAAPEAQESA